MKKYIASRVAEGNRLFPAEITLDQTKVIVKFPNLFSGQEKIIPYHRIAGVSVDFPLVGYSTIIIESTGEAEIKAHGFLKAEVIEMKNFILEKLNSKKRRDWDEDDDF